MDKGGEPIRVLHIVTRMNTGGVAVLIANLMRNFDPKYFEVKLITGICEESEEDYLEKVALDLPFTKIPTLQRSISPIKDFKALLSLGRKIRHFRPDVIHTHTSKAGLLGRSAALLFAPKAKRVHTFHGHLLDGYFSRVKTALLISLESMLAKKTHRLVAMGNQVKTDLLQVGVGKKSQFMVFFPGLVPPKIVTRESARAALELKLEKVYGLFVARLTTIKRPDRLLDAIAELTARGIDVDFLIVGDGELKDYVESRVSKENLPITLLGWQQDTSLAFSSADFLVLCSDNEAVSLVLIEASQYSLPLVSTNVGSVADILLDNSNGYLTEANPLSLADAIEKLARDTQLRTIMGEAGKARANQYFSLDRMLKDHTDLYRSL